MGKGVPKAAVRGSSACEAGGMVGEVDMETKTSTALSLVFTHKTSFTDDSTAHNRQNARYPLSIIYYLTSKPSCRDESQLPLGNQLPVISYLLFIISLQSPFPWTTRNSHSAIVSLIPYLLSLI
jgi:hypothetical protein